MKLSFRKEPPETGLAGVVRPVPSTVVKGDKLQIGLIEPPHYSSPADAKWAIRIMIFDPAVVPAGWKWVRFKVQCESEPQARQWLQAHWEGIQTKYKLRQSPND